MLIAPPACSGPPRPVRTGSSRRQSRARVAELAAVVAEAAGRPRDGFGEAPCLLGAQRTAARRGEFRSSVRDLVRPRDPREVLVAPHAGAWLPTRMVPSVPGGTTQKAQPAVLRGDLTPVRVGADRADLAVADALRVQRVPFANHRDGPVGWAASTRQPGEGGTPRVVPDSRHGPMSLPIRATVGASARRLPTRAGGACAPPVALLVQFPQGQAVAGDAASLPAAGFHAAPAPRPGGPSPAHPARSGPTTP